MANVDAKEDAKTEINSLGFQDFAADTVLRYG